MYKKKSEDYFSLQSLHLFETKVLGSQDLEEFGSQKFVQQHDVHFILQTLR